MPHLRTAKSVISLQVCLQLICHANGPNAKPQQQSVFPLFFPAWWLSWAIVCEVIAVLPFFLSFPLQQSKWLFLMIMKMLQLLMLIPKPQFTNFEVPLLLFYVSGRHLKCCCCCWWLNKRLGNSCAPLGALMKLLNLNYPLFFFLFLILWPFRVHLSVNWR